MHDVLYYQGLLDPLDIKSRYEDTILRILANDFHGLYPEKLAHHDVYSVRINRSDRLLYTKIRINNQTHLVLLDVVLNHDYDKSKFLKPQVLKTFMELHGTRFTDAINDAKFAPCVQMPQFSYASDHVKLARVDFSNHKFIQFNQNQLKAIIDTPFPKVISGAAGSGKSCVATALLSHYIEQTPAQELGHIAYLCNSSKLAENMADAWDSLPMAQNLPLNTVQFKSYEQLIKELVPNLEEGDLVDKIHTMEWLGRYKTIYKNIIKATRAKNAMSEYFLNEEEAIYQEFRIISSLETVEDYLQLGQKQSLFQDPEQRKWVFKAYTSYIEHLNSVKKIHLSFYALPQQTLYKRIIVDEAQDLSHLQLKNISQLVEKAHIAFCEDNSQSLIDNKPKTAFILDLIARIGKQAQHIVLPFSYRCPTTAIELANTVTSLKNRLTKGNQLPVQANPEQPSAGQVRWHASLTPAIIAELQQQAQSPQCVIITHEKYKQEAKALFKTPQIYTPEEIKGLEYQHVVVFKLLDDDIYKEANNELANLNSDNDAFVAALAKKNQGKEYFGPAFNAIYTAFTRTTDLLTVVQEKCHGLRFIIAELDKPTPIAPVPQPKPVIAQVTVEEWFQEAKLQLSRRNIDRARDIFLEKLNKTEKEFNQFKKAFLIDSKRAALSQVKKTTSSSSTSTSSTPTVATKVIEAPKKNPFADREYLTKLLKNCNKNNLLALFKHPKAIKYLFEIPLENGDCLFSTLFNDKWRAVLLEVIPEFTPVIAPHLTVLHLCQQLNDTDNKYPCFTPLFYMITQPECVKLLIDLSWHNPVLIKQIADLNLGTPFPESAGKYANSSLLYWLCYGEPHFKLFSRLLHIKPDLGKAIKSEDFFRRCKSSYIPTPFHGLVCTGHGQQCLVQVVKNNHYLLAHMQTEDLADFFQVFTDSGALSSTAFMFLLLWEYGVDFLTSICQQRPELIKALRASHLGFTFKQDGVVAGDSALYFICGSEKKRELFMKFIKINPLFIKDLPSSLLFNGRVNAKGNTTNPLYLLAAADDMGQSILAKIVEANPKFILQITPDVLFRPMQLIKNPEIMCAHVLSIGNAGQKIFRAIVLNNLPVAKAFTGEVLRKIIPSTDAIDENLSLLFLLANNPEGLLILEHVLNVNPALAAEIQAEELTRARPYTIDKFDAGTSPLFWLSICVRGRLILFNLLLNNPRLVHELQEHDLINPVRAKTEMLAHSCPIDYLSTTDDLGRKILQFIVVNNLKLGAKISTTLDKRIQWLVENKTPQASANPTTLFYRPNEELIESQNPVAHSVSTNANM